MEEILNKFIDTMQIKYDKDMDNDIKKDEKNDKKQGDNGSETAKNVVE